MSAGASASRSRSVTIPSGSASGTYRVYVILDNDSELDQISDANDYASPATFVVRVSETPPTLPNLRFSGSLSAAVSQGTGSAPSRLSVSALANNNGQSSSGSWRARLRLTTLGGEVLHSTSTEYGALNSGQSHNVIFADVLLGGALASGTFRAEVTLDSDNSVSEQSESDNAATSQFTVAPTPTSSAGEPSWTAWDAALFYTPGRTHPVDAIVIHTTGGGSYQSNIDWFKNPSNPYETSAHYVVSPFGEVTQMVSLSDTAHHATYYNSRSIGIEVVGLPNDPNTWTPEVYNALEKLVEYLASRFSIPLSHPSGDATTYPKLQFDQPGIVGHQQIQPIENPPSYSAKPDPGPYFDWPGFMESVGATYQQASLQLRFASQATPAALPDIESPQFGPLDEPESTGPALMISLPAERVVVIESSDDLKTWNVDATLTAGEGTTEYPVDITSHERRFFRLRWGIRE